MKLIDMKNADPDQDQEEGTTAPSPLESPQYPYGLCLNIDDEVMEKLGIVALPAVGQKMTLQAVVEVQTVSQYETAGGEKEQRLSLQITAMALGSGAKADAGEKLYGKGKGD